jgi:hypothetical protein
MITVEITCDTGKIWRTGINADLQGACDYFIGRAFVDEIDNGNETYHIVIKVAQIQGYHFEGIARQRGSIGITHQFTADVIAESPEIARLKLYDNWEHILITTEKTV